MGAGPEDEPRPSRDYSLPGDSSSSSSQGEWEGGGPARYPVPPAASSVPPSLPSADRQKAPRGEALSFWRGDGTQSPAAVQSLLEKYESLARVNKERELGGGVLGVARQPTVPGWSQAERKAYHSTTRDEAGGRGAGLQGQYHAWAMRHFNMILDLWLPRLLEEGMGGVYVLGKRLSQGQAVDVVVVDRLMEQAGDRRKMAYFLLRLVELCALEHLDAGRFSEVQGRILQKLKEAEMPKTANDFIGLF